MKKKLLNIGIISTCVTLALSGSVFALVPTIGGYLSRGVDDMCYYVDSSANAYTSYINTGINRWTNSGYSPRHFINMTAVSSNYATDVDYYAMNADDMIVGICYSTDNGNMYSLSIEIRNEDGLPYEYIVCYMDMNNKHDRGSSYLIRVSTYKYDDQNHIISASYNILPFPTLNKICLSL